MNRRRFLAGIIGGTGTAGCLRLVDEDSNATTEESGGTASESETASSRSLSLSSSDYFESLSNDPEFLKKRDGVLYSINQSVETVDMSTQRRNWKKELDFSHFASSALVTESRVYVGGSTRLYTLDRNTGEILWSFDTDVIDRDHPAIEDISATQEKVIIGVASAEGDDVSALLVLNASDGTQIFKQRFQNYCDSIVTHDGIAYLGVSNRSLGYDITNQETFSIQDRFGMRVTGDLEIAGERLLQRDGGVRVHDLEQKKTIFSQDLPGFGYVPPTIIGDIVVVGGETGVYGFDLQSGEQKWHIRTTTTVRAPILPYSSFVLTADTSGVVYAVDMTDGDLVIDKKLPDIDRIDTIEIVGETLLVAHNGVSNTASWRLNEGSLG